MIHSSLGWKFLNRYWQLNDKLLALSTRGRKVYDLILRGIKSFIKRNRSRSIIATFYRIRDRFLPIGTRRRKVAKFFFLLPSMFTGTNIRESLRYYKAHGFKSLLVKAR